MTIETENIRRYRLQAHTLSHKVPLNSLTAVAGVSGLQNTPPGSWETSLFNRLEGCTLAVLDTALHKEKSLLQAWSFRGAPFVFPTAESDVFLTALIPREKEQPWIYTRGITAGLEWMGMTFEELLEHTKQAVLYLNTHTVLSKAALDRALSEIVEQKLPTEKQKLWRAPSMYGNPKTQTVGDAIVSFLLRPCSFSSLVVFGERQGNSPTFTSFKNWTGQAPAGIPEAEKELVRKFLHCYGPATVDSFTKWLGSSPAQARRLWKAVAEEMEPVQVEGRRHFTLAIDKDRLLHPPAENNRLVLLGAHDPYLDLRDREIILQDKALQKKVWRFVANPGVVLRDGRIIGTWRVRTVSDTLDVSIILWEKVTPAERRALENLAEEYAVFRLRHIGKLTIEPV